MNPVDIAFVILILIASFALATVSTLACAVLWQMYKNREDES